MWDELFLGYTMNEGHAVLRQEIAKLHDVTEDDVTVVQPNEGLYIATNCLIHYFHR